MSTNHHTAIATNAAANASTINSPLGQLDQSIIDLQGGTKTFTKLKFDAATTLTISSGSITPTQSLHLVSAETGTTDNLDTITAVNNSILFLKATSTHTISLAELGNIEGITGLSTQLTGNRILALFCQNGTWYVLGNVSASEVDYNPGSLSDWNSSTDPGNVDDALDQLASRTTTLETNGVLAILRDQKSTGTDGGTSTSTSWNARNLNTEVYDPGSIVSISSNQFTPIAGTYHLRAMALSNRSSSNRLRLYNVTGAASVGEGLNALNENAAGADQGSAHLIAIFTANGTDAYRIDHYITNGQATNGLGSAVGDGSNEVYLEITLEKIG